MDDAFLAPDYAPEGAPADLPAPAQPFPADGCGVVIVDKPLGLTSQQVVSRLRRLFGIRKIGHIGTLDPAASGMLICALGRATRLIRYVQAADKTYRARVRFGIETSTEDAEGEVTATHGAQLADIHAGLEDAFERWRGPIWQRPSSVSAIKVDGQRAYARVRAGEDVVLQHRQVIIYDLHAVGEPVANQAAGVDVVDVDIEVTCSSGTYIRALARDLGETLGCGAHLTALRRVAVAEVTLDQASTLGDIARDVAAHGAADAHSIINPAPLVGLSQRTLVIPDSAIGPLLLGQSVEVDPQAIVAATRPGSGDGLVQLLDEDSHIVALAALDSAGGHTLARPRVVIGSRERK